MLLLTGLALMGGGGYAAMLEGRPYLDAGITPAAKFASLEEGRATFGPSPVTQRLLLDNCFDAMRSIYGRTQPGARRAAVAEFCRGAADSMTRTTPTLSFAWYIGALAAAATKDVAGMNERLSQSQTTGPFEQWVAELRVDLAEDHFAELTPAVLKQHESDLRLLAQSKRGVASIGERYVRDETFRQRIFEIVEDLPNEDQARFVEMVEQSTQAAVRRLQ